MTSPGTDFFLLIYDTERKFPAVEQSLNPTGKKLVAPITTMPLLHQKADLTW